MKFFFSLLLFLIAISNHAQERETRAVWIATNYRLDWPPSTFDAELQKKSLIEIFDNLKSKNFNTVYFQVRFNGTVLFKSSFEPISPYINGEVDGDISYDPLEFAVEQAHKHGFEIHAWINTNLVFTGNEEKIFSDPTHICQQKPEWIVEYKSNGEKSFWLDPGLPEVRDYLSDLISELVENYDVDGINLDYIRYPGKDFDDDFSFNIYGKGLPRDEFRRQNINSLIKEIYRKVKELRPEIKVGASPIGVYRRLKGMNSWESYSDLYQDSYQWLKNKIVDYLSPQIYWSINENPSFEILSKDWIENSNGRNIVLGIGAYKENVRTQINDMINLSRKLKASGVSFFRYENIKNYDFKLFSHKIFPADMPWLNFKFPVQPTNLSYKNLNDERLFTLYWQTNEITFETDSVKYFSIYNLPDSSSIIKKEFLFDVIEANKNYVNIAIDNPRKVNYYFAIKSINKVWAENPNPTNVIKIEIPKMLKLVESGIVTEKPLLIKRNELESFVFIISKKNDQIEIYGGVKNFYSLLKKEKIFEGKNFIGVNDLLKKYESVKIKFNSNNREFLLKLKSL